MKTLILAGGFGTRFAEETDVRPKPMIEIGGQPILWHIMKIYSLQGFSDFIVATGYKSEIIDNWTKRLSEPWNVQTIYTGEQTQTGGRIKKCFSKIDDERLFATYGDGLGNVNLSNLLNFHLKNGCSATVTAVRPPARFGVITMNGIKVSHFGEKNQADAGWINGGFFVLERKVVDYVNSDSDSLENSVLPKLATEGLLTAFKHNGFWQPMDTLREKRDLENLAQKNIPPWFKTP